MQTHLAIVQAQLAREQQAQSEHYGRNSSVWILIPGASSQADLVDTRLLRKFGNRAFALARPAEWNQHHYTSLQLMLRHIYVQDLL